MAILRDAKGKIVYGRDGRFVTVDVAGSGKVVRVKERRQKEYKLPPHTKEEAEEIAKVADEIAIEVLQESDARSPILTFEGKCFIGTYGRVGKREAYFVIETDNGKNPMPEWAGVAARNVVREMTEAMPGYDDIDDALDSIMDVFKAGMNKEMRRILKERADECKGAWKQWISRLTVQIPNAKKYL